MSATPLIIPTAHRAPLPNSYWVVPGRLLAGEYPAARALSDTADRLQSLLFAKVTMFVDLTEEGEGPAYSHLLMYAAGADPIKYVRYPIGGDGLPESPQAMQDILETIDVHLAQQGVVYVHCTTGAGRAATVIGCYLVRLGLAGDEGLDRLNEVWTESERSHACPKVPDTSAQTEYVRQWLTADSSSTLTPTPMLTTMPAQAPTSAKLDRYVGALLGMAVGEALGAMVTVDPRAVVAIPKIEGLISEFSEGGPHSVPRGAWLSDTAMSWCLAESLLASNGHNPEDQMRRYLEWQRDGKYASAASAHKVPADVNKALAQWQWTHKALAGSQDPENRDAHALARTVAVALYFAGNPTRAVAEAADAARTTLQAPLALDANRVFATALLDALQGVDKDTLISLKQSDNAKQLRRGKLKFPMLQTIDGWWRGPVPPARVGSDVVAVLRTALWAFERTDNFREGVILAANLCGKPTSSGAVFGALAGAYYGVQGIPQEWRSVVLQAQPLTDLATRLANA